MAFSSYSCDLQYLAVFLIQLRDLDYANFIFQKPFYGRKVPGR